MESAVAHPTARDYQGPWPSDPTAATTAQILREVALLKEQTFAALESRLAALVVRLDAMDKAVGVFHDDLVSVPTDVDKQVGALRDLVFMRIDDMAEAVKLVHETIARIPEEQQRSLAALKELLLQMLTTQDVKFQSVNTEFVLRDERVKQTATDTKVAVDAALQAAEKAVQKQNESFSLSIDKSEKATLEQINQQRLLLQTATQGLNDKIDDIKERLTRQEGRDIGVSTTTASHQAANGLTMDRVGLLIAGLAFVALLIKDFVRP